MNRVNNEKLIKLLDEKMSVIYQFFIGFIQYILRCRNIILLRSLKKTKYSDPLKYNKMGFIYTKMKNYKMAHRCYKQAVQLDPNNDIYWSNKGYSLVHLVSCNKDNEVYAKQAFDKAIELNSHNVKSWLNRCYMEYISGNYETALAYCNKAMEFDNKFYITYFNRGMIYLKDCKYESAIIDFNKYLKQTRFSFLHREKRKTARKELKAYLIYHSVRETL